MRYHAGRYSVFPTCVGVNRVAALAWNSVVGVPHMRGGEPAFFAGL